MEDHRPSEEETRRKVAELKQEKADFEERMGFAPKVLETDTEPASEQDNSTPSFSERAQALQSGQVSPEKLADHVAAMEKAIADQRARETGMQRLTERGMDMDR